MKGRGLRSFAPAIVSALVCPGVGQMMKGEVLKGIGIIILLVLGLFTAVVVTVLTSIKAGIALGILLVAIYLWNIYDAYST